MYKVTQSIHANLEKDLNDYAEQGYIWVCKLCSWNTEYQGHKEKLFTYLLKKVK